MKVLIIDDDPLSIESLSQKLKAYEDITLGGTARNGSSGIRLVKQEQPDLLFLDVELPDMSGLEFLSQITSLTAKPCKVVIYTAHNMYMLPAFRGKAFDFLLKPIDDGELQKIIQRFYMEYDEPHTTPATAPAEGDKGNDKLLLYENANDFRLVNIRDVGVFQYNHELRSWEVLVAGRKEPIRLKRSVNNETLITMDQRFIQVNQRYIINIDYLMEVNDSVCRLYPPFDKVDYVKVGRTYRKQLTDRFSAL
ncbi:MAG: response regulator transcription factor [Prevotella sp.]|nr:response regulator transcription factor [Prevotella sp.]